MPAFLDPDQAMAVAICALEIAAERFTEAQTARKELQGWEDALERAYALGEANQ